MPEPNEYLIAKHLQTALSGIALAGGYYYDVAAMAVKMDPDVQPESLVGPDGPRPFVLLDVQPDTFEIAGTKPNRATVRQPFTVYWVHDADPTVDDSFMQLYFRGCADVERAITADISRGGRAFDTRIVGRTARRPRGFEVWAQITALVTVTRVYGQP